MTTPIRDPSVLQAHVLNRLQPDNQVYVSKRGSIVQRQQKKAGFFARLFLGRKVTAVYRTLSAHGSRKVNKKDLHSSQKSRDIINAFLKNHVQQDIGGGKADNQIKGRDLRARKVFFAQIDTYLPTQTDKPETPLKGANLIVTLNFIKHALRSPDTFAKNTHAITEKPNLATINEESDST